MTQRSRSPRAAALLAAVFALLPPGQAAGKTPHKPFWLKGTTITEYYPAPESWFVGRKVRAPGLGRKHRIDWLYSATGVSMEGDGVGLDGERYHLDRAGTPGWVNSAAKPTHPGRSGWSDGSPFWRAGAFWRNSAGGVTFPLEAGGWSRGKGHHYVKPPKGISFAAGPSLALRYWRSLATDPRVIPRGSRVYIPAYRKKPGGGWFRAEDTGSAIIGKHVDVYRPPPSKPGGGRYLKGQRIHVYPPK